MDTYRTDDLYIKGFKIMQDPSAFCFGIDAVLLADFAKMRRGETVLDLGCGNGVIPLLLLAKNEEIKATCLEIQEDMAYLAKKNAELNGVLGRMEVISGDLKNIEGLIAPKSVDAVTANPPYKAAPDGLKNSTDAKTIARHEVKCSLKDIISSTAYSLRPMGRLYMVHRPERLSEIFGRLLEYGLEPKRMRLVHPFLDSPPKLLLIEARKNANPGMRIEPPLIIHEKGGGYTNEIEEIYRRGEA